MSFIVLTACLAGSASVARAFYIVFVGSTRLGEKIATLICDSGTRVDAVILGVDYGDLQALEALEAAIEHLEAEV